MDYIKKFLEAKATITSSKWGFLTMEAASFTPAVDGDLIVHLGKPLEQNEPLVRIHSECLFGDVFHSTFCDCGRQLEMALDRMHHEGNGLLFYLRFDGRGAGLAAKVSATALEVAGTDTYESRMAIGVPPEGRDFTGIARYLQGKGIHKIRLLTNNPQKSEDLSRNGIEVDVIPLLIESPDEDVRRLYRTKALKFHHSIPRSCT